MPSTADFHDLLETDGVVAINYHAHTDTLRVHTCADVPDSRITTALGSLNVASPSTVDIVALGFAESDGDYIDALGIDSLTLESDTDRKDRVDPIQPGVSEIQAGSTAATAGAYPVTVTRDAGVWADSVQRGDTVRISNNHVYSRFNELGDDVMQPSPRDGGDPNADVVGECVGYAPVENGTTVDVAARSIDHDRTESGRPFDLEEMGDGVWRRPFEEIVGDDVTKTGRTSGVTSAEITDASASIRVNFGGDIGVIRVEDMVLTGQLASPGDSGSPTFHVGSRKLAGLVFAGSATTTVLCKATNIEDELGVVIAATNRPTAEITATLTVSDGGGGGGDGDDDDDAPVPDYGVLTATVAEPGSRVVPDATVEVTAPDGDFDTTLTTDATGKVEATVPVTTLELTARKDGFTTDSATVKREGWSYE